jgi:hypothetical protein
MGFMDRIVGFFCPCCLCDRWDMDNSGHKVCRKSLSFWDKIYEKQAEEKLLEEESKKLGEE